MKWIEIQTSNLRPWSPPGSKTLSLVGSLILATESTQLLTTHFTEQEIALILKYETKRVEGMLHYNLKVWVQDFPWVER